MFFIAKTGVETMKIQKHIVAAFAVGTLLMVAGCAAHGKAAKAATKYWNGKQFSILEGHWGAPTEKTQNEDGTSTAIFRTTDDCTATFSIDAQGIISDHDIVGTTCRYDAYNRLQNIEH